MEKQLSVRNPEYVATGAVAEHCGVCKVTVLRWIDKGYLVAFRLPSGHYRIRNDDFNEFLVKHKMPGYVWSGRKREPPLILDTADGNSTGS